MDPILIAIAAAALAVVITLRWGVVAQRKEAPETTPEYASAESVRSHVVALDGLTARMGKLEADHTDVRAAVAHGIEDIERVDNRIKATIRRTTKQLEEAGVESPTLNAEAEQLRVIDGGGGDEPELPSLHEELDEVPSSIPGVPASTLAKIRGIYGAA